MTNLTDTGALQLGLFPGFDTPAAGVVRGYVPACYADETAPEPLSSPDRWIVTLKDGAPALSPANALEALADQLKAEGDDRPMVLPLAHDEIVNFLRLTDHGGAILTVDDAGGYTVTRDMPIGVQICIDNDPETISSSIEGLVSEFEPEPGEYRLSYYEWSDPIPYRLDAVGKRFALVEAA